MYRFAVAVTAMLVAAVASMVAGCQPSSPPPSTPTGPPPSSSPASPVPTPTYLCTPEAGGEETPCSQRQYDEMKTKDALYAEAETVYRRMFDENIRVSRSGGLSEPSQVILETTAGQAQSSLMEIFRDLASNDLKARGSDPTVQIQREAGFSKEGSIVALLVCVDASQWAFYKDDDLVSKGRPAQDRVYFGRIHDVLKMIYVEGRWVDSCE